MKAAAAEPFERRKFARNARAFRDQFVRQGDVQARYLPFLFVGLTFAATFGHGLLLLGQGSISVGDLVAVIGLVGVLRGPADLSIFTFALVQLGFAGARRTLELIKAETELDENPDGHAAVVEGDLRFTNVSFSFPGSAAETLNGVSFHARPGETIAIVGQTGSGKSTLTKLVNRTFDVDSGGVEVDGVDVVEAAKAAQAHDFITSVPGGYDTVIGERGATLSGGQRQRLAIARAILTDPRILILDDATSAIDSATEDQIQKAINHVLAGRTSLVITHRLSQIRRADRIIIIDKARLVAEGTHADLLESNDLYQRIFQRFN